MKRRGDAGSSLGQGLLAHEGGGAARGGESSGTSTSAATFQPRSFFSRGANGGPSITPSSNSTASGPRSYSSRNAPPSNSENGEGAGVWDHIEHESFEEAGYSWDFVFVLPVPQGSKTGGSRPAKKSTISCKYEPNEVIQTLHNAGLQTYLYRSAQQDEIICKIRASVRRLQYHADQVNYSLMLDEEAVRKQAAAGVLRRRPEDEDDDQDDEEAAQIAAGGMLSDSALNRKYLIRPIIIPHDPKVTELRPFQFLYAAFDSGSVRIKLLMSIFELKEDFCCGMNLAELVHDGSLLAYYPLHDRHAREVLKQHWLDWSVQPWQQPIDAVREYFGEKIGLYFEFLAHYTTWLLMLTAAGLVFCLNLIIEWGIYGSLSEALAKAVLAPVFCAFTAFWAQLMLEHWKRTESTKAMEWGMVGFEAAEFERPGFEGVPMRSVIDGRQVSYFPPAERNKRVFFSYFIISGLTLFVIAVIACIFTLKFYMYVVSDNPDVNAWSGPVSSILNAVQIQVLNYVYSELAIFLNKRENHRTDTSYEDALISKLFAFQFVNSFASLFYVAFVKEAAGDPCSDGSCMGELGTSLAIIFVGNAQEVLMPLAMGWIRARQEAKKEDAGGTSGTSSSGGGAGKPEGYFGMSDSLTRAEQEYSMETYDVIQGTLDDYAELAIQFGYSTLFVAAFPLAPLLAYVSNVAEVRVDGWKLLFAYRRALPCGAEDIGTWMSIFQITSTIAVMTNSGIVAFTMDTFDGTEVVYRWVYFVCMQYAVLFLMGYVAFIVPDVPEEVTIQLQRQGFIVDKVVRQISDETDARLALDVQEAIVIHDTDDERPGASLNPLGASPSYAPTPATATAPGPMQGRRKSST